MSADAVGIDLGGTQIKGVAVTREGEVLQRELRSTPDTEFADVIALLASELGPHLPVGISAPGLAAKDRRSIVDMPGRLQGLEGLNWTEKLSREVPVPVLNDAQAALLGEAWIGAARRVADAILLTLGTGVGGAILSEGRLLRGHLGRAGHFGHLCLDPYGPPSITRMPGALEGWIGNYSIRDRTKGRFETTHAVIEAFREGDELASKVWLRSIRALACGISSLINAIDPEVVVIGGGIAQAGDALFEPLQRALAEVEWRPGNQAVRIVPAELGEWAGAIGSARMAMDSV